MEEQHHTRLLNGGEYGVDRRTFFSAELSLPLHDEAFHPVSYQLKKDTGMVCSPRAWIRCPICWHQAACQRLT